MTHEGAAHPATPSKGSATSDWVRALQRTATITPGSRRTIAVAVAENARAHGDRPALCGELETLTHASLAARADFYAHWAWRQGLGKGDRVCLMLENEPDYAAIWIGLSSLGVVTALINTQLVGEGLAHCVAVAGARHLIVGASLCDRVATLHFRGEIWCHGADHAIYERIDRARGPVTLGPKPDITLADPALLIYTSGTTGLPKAAHVSHYRIMMWAEWFAGIMDASHEDRLYDCLPMYHSVGGVVAVGAMLVAGGSVIVRNGFSATRFWPDVVESRATIFQYIGELCRYLVGALPTDLARRHTLRLCVGNGLRAEVWAQFEKQFEIPRIIEFYAATEGTFSLFNLDGKVGSIGRVPRFIAHTSPVAIVAFDPESEEPRREPDGHCLRATVGEAGEAIGRIAGADAALSTRFEGYSDVRATERKILRNVFEDGDAWFRTGDLMKRDREGFFYFVDRIGDTFRWKGENVATSDVSRILLASAGVDDATVYGVEVPGQEGRAGMAALVTGPSFDLERLHAHVERELPRYARPMFLRIGRGADVTSTFRPKKQALIDDGFDRSRSEDAIYVDVGDRYRQLDDTTVAEILAGALRL